MADQIVSQLSLLDPLEFPLTKGYVTLVDPIDADLSVLKWHAIKPDSTVVYAYRSLRRGSKRRAGQYLHRVIMERIIGRPLEKHERVDHIDTNSLNNQRHNLRLATHGQNNCNTGARRTNKSGYKGVSWNPRANKWDAEIAFNGKRLRLGRFDTPQEAHAAYCAAGRELHGEFFNPGATPQERTE